MDKPQQIDTGLIREKLREMDSLEVNEPEELNEYPEPISWEDFDKKKFPEERWRIKGLIPKEGFTILASVAGERKTWIALEMARSIVLGKNFADNTEFKTIPGNVLYIDMEMPASELQRRGRQLQITSTPENKFLIINQGDYDLSDTSYQVDLEFLIKEYNISTVFVDTLRAVAGGLKEDKAEDVRKFFNDFKEYKNMGVSFVWLDHLRKPLGFEGKMPKKEQLLGSQDKTASVEVLLMIKSEEESEEISVFQRKNRIGTELKPFTLILRDEVGKDNQITTRLSYGGIIEEKESQKERAKDMIMHILSEEGKTTPEILSIVYTQIKVANRNTGEALRELVAEGKIKARREGRKNFYYIPEEADFASEMGVYTEERKFFDDS